MHILTKVFVVLVALLAVALVPLIAVQTNNQAALRQQVKDQEVQAAAARAALDTERALRAKVESDTASHVRDLDAALSRVNSDLASCELRAQSLATQIAQKEVTLASSVATVKLSEEGARVQSALNETLREELSTYQAQVAAFERNRIELEDKYSKAESDLRGALESKRDLEEQRDEVKRQLAKTDQVVRDFTAKHGPSSDEVAALGAVAPIPDRDISAQILDVQRTDMGVFAEIDAGSRDGIRDGWLLTISDGSRFIGKLRITNTDVNRAVGIVELEDLNVRGPVSVGQRAGTRKGQ